MGIDAKIEATWDIDDPIFTPRERAALEMATMFTEDYHAFNDENVAKWKEYFTDEEFVELGCSQGAVDRTNLHNAANSKQPRKSYKVLSEVVRS